MKTSLLVIGVIVVLVVGVAGLYAAGYLNPQAVSTVRVGYLANDLHQLPLHVAIANGYFNESGIKLETFSYDSGPNLMQHFVVGELDFAYVGIPPAMTARANSLNSSNVHLPVVVGSSNLEGSTLVVRADSGINTIADLNGKRIGTPGTGTIQDTLLTMLMTDYGLSLTKYPARIIDLPVYLSRGEIDGFIGWEVAPAIAEYTTGAQVLITSHEMFPDHQCCVLVVSDKYLAAHPEVVQKFVKAHNNAIDYINSHPDEAKQVGVNYTRQPEQVVDLAFGRVVYDKTLNVESMKIFLTSMINAGTVTTLTQGQVDTFINAMIDTRYIQ